MEHSQPSYSPTILKRSNPTEEELYTSSFLFFLNVLRLIKKATNTIEIDMYIFAKDKLGNIILKNLKSAAERGVEVRIIVDGIGSLDFINTKDSGENLAPLDIKIYNPAPWPLSQFKLKEFFSIKRFFSFLSLLNRRNHKKIIIIDKKVAFLGSHNLFNQALHWRESSVMIKNSKTIKDLLQIFQWTWQQSLALGDPLPAKVKKPAIKGNQLYFTSHFGLRKLLRKELIQKINQASENIQITMPYFYPPIPFLNALQKAARRGVSVEIILPQNTDVWFFPRVSRPLYASLLCSGIKIYEYKGTMIHAKQVLIDDWCLIGSSNLNPRSFFLDLEIDYVIAHKKNREKIKNQFSKDKDRSLEVQQENIYQYQWIHMLNYFLAKTFKRWI